MDSVKPYIAVIKLFICLLLAVTLTTPAIADVTYTYTGNNFDNFAGPSTPPPQVTSVSGYFTQSAPLPPNLILDSPLNYGFIAYSFTDGLYNYNNTNVTDFRLYVSTDVFGDITAWQMDFTIPHPSVTNAILTLVSSDYTSNIPTPNSHYEFDFADFTLLPYDPNSNWYQVFNMDEHGLWSVTSTSPAAVPEPTTMLLIGSGLIGLWGARKKFRK